MVEAAAADPCDNMSAQEIKDHMTAIAEQHIAARESYRSIRTDASKNLNIWQTNEQGVPLTICTMDGPGLTIDDMKAWNSSEALPANISIVEKNATARLLEHDLGVEDSFTMYQHIKTPMVISNRCIFMSVFNFDLPNGGFVNMTTSKGMKAIEQANTALIGKDVLSQCIVAYHKYEPLEDGSGVRINAIMCVDVRGSMP